MQGAGALKFIFLILLCLCWSCRGASFSLSPGAHYHYSEETLQLATEVRDHCSGVEEACLTAARVCRPEGDNSNVQ